MKRLLMRGGGVVIVIALMAFTAPVKQFCFSVFTTKASYMTQDTLAPVKVELEKTSIKDMPVLFIHDTAATTEAIKDVLGKAYGELMQYTGQNKLQPMKFLAWYYSMQPPWSIDIAVETDRIPAQLNGRIQSRIQQGGEVLIAHMWGAYDQVGQAYIQIGNWLRQNKRRVKGNSFEVYINDPSTVKSSSEIRTDIYQPLE
ncbi:MAG: GyrI-like domain-containing protein [Bacteroidota bacterium]|nr:GyrI-like domain-containing protein [Bacteroidota bacterium]